jgi:alpha-glucosidase
MVIGEAFGDPATLMRFIGGDALDGLHLAFNFQLIREGRTSEGNTAWDAARIRRVVDQTEAALPAGAWTNYVWGNHDVSRFVSRYNIDGRGRERARLAAMLLLTLRGTPFIYYGDEIGMEDVPIPEERAQDPARFAGPNRDPERTPMPWTAAPERGFTTGDPWLPFGDTAINVADQENDPASLLSLYRRLLWYRKGSDALRFGDYRPVELTADQVFAYLRAADGDRLLILLNFGIEPIDVTLPEGIAPAAIVLSTHGSRATATASDGSIRLDGLEGVIVTLE